MARFEFKLPDIGEGVAEGEVVAWHVKPGDVVKEDQAMVEVMTDKATVTIGAPRAGKIEKLLCTVGAVLKVGDEVEAKFTGVDRKGRTIALSIKAKEAHEEAEAVQNYKTTTESSSGTSLGDLLKEHIGGQD